MFTKVIFNPSGSSSNIKTVTMLEFRFMVSYLVCGVILMCHIGVLPVFVLLFSFVIVVISFTCPWRASCVFSPCSKSSFCHESITVCSLCFICVPVCVLCFFPFELSLFFVVLFNPSAFDWGCFSVLPGGCIRVLFCCNLTKTHITFQYEPTVSDMLTTVGVAVVRSWKLHWRAFKF